MNRKWVSERESVQTEDMDQSIVLFWHVLLSFCNESVTIYYNIYFLSAFLLHFVDRSPLRPNHVCSIFPNFAEFLVQTLFQIYVPLLFLFTIPFASSVSPAND